MILRKTQKLKLVQRYRAALAIFKARKFRTLNKKNIVNFIIGF